MANSFVKNFVVTVLCILGLLVLDRLPALMGGNGNRVRLQKTLLQMHNGELNRDDFDALAAGYYEGLRKDAVPAGLPVESDDIRYSNDFLRYEFKPHVKRRYAAGMRITNSLGMPNPEYSYQKPPHTRRIALFGDSISVGPYGHDYVALLEDALNRDYVTPETQKFQVLNFSVYGYRVIQMMDVAIDIAPKFHPDVYLVALTGLQANRKASWSAHIARLELDGTDLKYDFLRGIAARAGLQASDHYATMIRKLGPYHLEVTQWALEQIRDQAALEGIPMVVILVPAPTNPEVIAQAFDEMRSTLHAVGVPVIDLRDAFRATDKRLEDLQVETDIDIHPNALGHQLIFQNLYQQIQQNPKFAASLLGTAGKLQEPAERSR